MKIGHLKSERNHKMWKQTNRHEWTFGDVGRIIQRNAKYYAFYREVIMSGYDTLEEAMKIIENPTITHNSKLDERYTVRP